MLSMRIRSAAVAILLVTAPFVSLAGTLTTATVRMPTAGELSRLTSDAFDAFFGVPDLHLQWAVTDSNSHGWIIGTFRGSSYDGSFVFRGGTITCCWEDEMWLTDINESDQIVGSSHFGRIAVFGTAIRLNASGDGAYFDWSSVADIAADAALFPLGMQGAPGVNDFLSISEDGTRIMTRAGILYLTDPNLSSASSVPEPGAGLLVCSGAVLIASGATRRRWCQSSTRGRT